MPLKLCLGGSTNPNQGQEIECEALRGGKLGALNRYDLTLKFGWYGFL